VLLIHGTADVNIPELQSRELHQVNPEATELWEVQGAAHVSAMTAEPQEYRRRVLAWFAEH
jgi:pimeloyl-ACP methyl ester carboxylesterase